MKLKLVLATAVALGLSVSTGLAADSFPSRAIRLVVAYPAGGVIDIASRVMAEALSKKFGQTVIVENKTGGDGTVGMLEVVRAEPDGYTLLSDGFGGQLIPPLLKKNFPVDVLEQLTFIARPAEFANVLVVSKNSPIKSVEDLIAAAKAKGDAMNFGSSGSATSDRLTMEMFMQTTGVKMTNVPYKGSAAALADLVGGVTDVMFANMPPALGLIRSGDVRALAVTSSYRMPQLPDVPTLAESGVEGFTMTSWNGIYAPAGLPDDIRDKLSAAFTEVVKDPAVSAKLQQIGFAPVGDSAEAFRSFFVTERGRWKTVIDASGISVSN